MNRGNSNGSYALNVFDDLHRPTRLLLNGSPWLAVV